MRQRQLFKLLALLLVFALGAAACGGDDDDSSSGDDTTAGDDTGSDDDGDDAADEGDDAADEGDDADDTDDTADAGDEAEGDVDTEVEEEDPAIERVYGGDISVGLEAEAVSLRPWDDTCSSPCYNIQVTIFDKLMEQDVDGNYQGWLAESITPNDDFTVWTMVLRSGVTFHDGSDFNAQSVADMFPVQLTGTQGSANATSANLTGVEATGEFEVTYSLSTTNSAFPAFLSRAALGLVFEPGAAAADPEAFSNAPVGTGPFMMEKRDIDNETVVVRNDSYWGTDPDGNQLPFLDSITFRPIPDEGNRLDALLSGTVTAIGSLRQGTIRDARAEDGITLFEYQGSTVGGGHFNTLVAPLDDVRVRQGLNRLNDQETVLEALGGTGISLPGTQFFSPDSPWYSEAVAAAWPEFDFNAGKALLQEYVDDPTRSDGRAVGDKIAVELACPPDPTLTAAMQVIEQVWTASELVDVTLSSVDQATHIGIAFTDAHQAHCWRFSDDNDPSITFNAGFAPPTEEIAAAAGIPGVVSPVNWANWFNVDAFTASQAAIQTDDFAQRKAFYEQIGLLMAEEAPVWYSGYTATMIATDPALLGLASWHVPSGDLGSGLPNAEGHWSEVWLAEG